MWDLPKGERFLPKMELDELKSIYYTETKDKTEDTVVVCN